MSVASISGVPCKASIGLYSHLCALQSALQTRPDQVAHTARAWAGAAPQQRVIVVAFIGGVTFAEIAGLRWLSSRANGRIRFVVATTKLLNGRTLMESFFDPSLLLALRQAQ